MKKNTEPLQPDTFYHIYNRGINGESIFKEERNYTYFLEKYALNLSPVVDTYAYCLLGNHFHILIRTKSLEALIDYQRSKHDKKNKKGKDDDSFFKEVDPKKGRLPLRDDDHNKDDAPLLNKDDDPLRGVILIEPADKIISKQFGTFFKTYAISFNNTYGRTGGLFETPFRRIEVDSDAYFTRMVWYIHFNPQKHGLIDDFREYPYSSYHSHLFKKATKLQRKEVLECFGGENGYVDFHSEAHKNLLNEKYLLE